MRKYGIENSKKYSLTNDRALRILVFNGLEVGTGVLVSNTIFKLVRLRGQFSFRGRCIFGGWGIDGWIPLGGWHGSDNSDQNKDG